ncbi:MAG: SIR2 family protein [Parvibaculaceae bacterium]|nr:SIR2 family protein [Parvibaculaceae bacterium]
MRFFANGPDIPDEVLNARDEGRVVFFCGAGVSRAYAGLPGFIGLAEEVLADLGSARDSDERHLLKAIKKVSTETELEGLISADRIFTLLQKSFEQEQIERSVSEALAVTGSPNLKAHKILLDLARQPSGSIRLVTTNFDRLFEKCAPKVAASTRSRLPRVKLGDGDWGIVHLHGRVNEDYSGSDDDGFVLSGGEFGDAYLAEGWARDFVREILDNYLAVFVGYSAEDPPVRYLLEGLQRSRPNTSRIYAFQDGPDDEAIAKWDDKGVTAISYKPDDDHHSVLYETLKAWALRANDPTAWRDRTFNLARRGPAKLKPHQRGMIAHIVKTSKGASAFSNHRFSLSPEWLCTFDASVRYARPSLSRGDHSDGELVNPFKLYGLDSDPLPPGQNEKLSRQGAIPEGAWDAFSFNTEDSQSLDEHHTASVRGRYAHDVPRLPPRLSALGDWIAHVADKPATVWWAAGQYALHPEICDAVRRHIDGDGQKVSKAVKEAWRLVFELIDSKTHNDLAGFQLNQAIEVHGWTPDLIRQFGRIYAPRLQRCTSFRNPRPPLAGQKIRRHDLVDVTIEYPEHLDRPIVPDRILSQIVSAVRNNVEMALDLERQYTSWFEVVSIEQEDDEEEEDINRSYGLSAYVLYFSELFRRLLSHDIGSARREFQRWRTDDEVFQRLRAWAASFSDVASPAVFAGEILSLADNAFWGAYAKRDVLLSLCRRWDELNVRERKKIEARIRKGPKRYRAEEDVHFKERAASTTLDWFHWLVNQGCEFTFDLAEVTETLLAVAPGWEPKSAETAAEGVVSRAGWVRTETDPKDIVSVPVSKVIEVSRKLDGRREDFLVEYKPFAGLSDVKPIRAISALAKARDFPESYWETFLNRDTRKEDSLRLKMLIAGRLSQIDRPDFARISLTASRWFKYAGPALRTDAPPSFERLWSHFIDTLKAESEASGSALVRQSDDVDWVMEAINSPAGNLAELHMTDPAKNGLKVGGGFPRGWLKKVRELLGLPGDSRRYVLAIFTFNLHWFHAIDPSYTDRTFVSILEKTKDTTDKEAVWAGFFWGARVPHTKLYVRMKPLLLQTAREGSALRRKHSEILSGIILAGWGSRHRGKSLISDAEYRSILLGADDQFRAHTLWQLERWSTDEKWSKQVVPFLRNVWPRQKKARTPKISGRLADLAIHQERNFPEVVSAVVPLIMRPDDGALTLYRLRSADSGVMRSHPDATLTLLYAMLAEDSSRWPYGAREILKELGKQKPKLMDDPRMAELLGRLD